MVDLVLIRAGQSEYEGQGRIQGTLDVPLSTSGCDQVEQAAEELRAAPFELTALYAGPDHGVQQTASTLGKLLGLKPKTLELLTNIDLGLWQGMLVDDVKQKQPKVFKKWRGAPDSVCPPQGETLQRVRERLQKAVAKIEKKHRAGVVGIVMPGPLVHVARSELCEQPVADLWKFQGSEAPLWELIETSARRGS